MDSATYLIICHYTFITSAIYPITLSWNQQTAHHISLYLYYISNLVRVFSHGLNNLSHRMSTIFQLRQQSIPPLLSWNQQSISTYATISPLHQQYSPTTLSWTQQSISSYVTISPLHQQYSPIVLPWTQKSISSHVTTSLLHQQYSPITLSWTLKSITSY
jgi:hypothetical protein